MARTRGTTTQRGYGAAHAKLRAEWQPHIDAGQAQCTARICLHRTRQIHPGTAWDLGHTDDRTRYDGPQHARCNRADGARRGNRARTPTPSVSRAW